MNHEELTPCILVAREVLLVFLKQEGCETCKILNEAIVSLQQDLDKREYFPHIFDPLSWAITASLWYSGGGYFRSFSLSAEIEIRQADGAPCGLFFLLLQDGLSAADHRVGLQLADR